MPAKLPAFQGLLPVIVGRHIALAEEQPVIGVPVRNAGGDMSAQASQPDTVTDENGRSHQVVFKPKSAMRSNRQLNFAL